MGKEIAYLDWKWVRVTRCGLYTSSTKTVEEYLNPGIDLVLTRLTTTEINKWCDNFSCTCPIHYNPNHANCNVDICSWALVVNTKFNGLSIFCLVSLYGATCRAVLLLGQAYLCNSKYSTKIGHWVNSRFKICCSLTVFIFSVRVYSV